MTADLIGNETLRDILRVLRGPDDETLPGRVEDAYRLAWTAYYGEEPDLATLQALRASSPAPERETPEPPCTGLTATWCPVHGDCTCEREFEQGLDAPSCPLHAFDSQHANKENARE